jgi:hypothetical protein
MSFYPQKGQVVSWVKVPNHAARLLSQQSNVFGNVIALFLGLLDVVVLDGDALVVDDHNSFNGFLNAGYGVLNV